MPKKAAKKKSDEKVSAAAKPGAKKSGAALVVVESPAKERTIARFLKSGYVVRSSYGHVRDLPVRKMGVDVKKGFAPEYVLLPRAKKILAEFKPLVEKSSYVYLATDPDREGEAIAWHLSEILGLPPERIRRIAFHEITPQAVAHALESPRAIDLGLVQAQQARRVIDRLVGYTLSPLLWAKIQRGLSAGRVQSVAVRFLTERDKEIKEFQSETFWTAAALCRKEDSAPFECRLVEFKGEKVETQKTYALFAEDYRVRQTILRAAQDADAVEASLAGDALKVKSIERKEARRRPPPPFSTSLLQQAASQKLGFVSDRTMRIAQSLYEGVDIGADEPVGLITYMRTDSFAISEIAAAEAAAYLKGRFGPRYVPAEPPKYQTKSRGAQEAHEAVRPTGIARTPESLRKYLSPEQHRLYDLIWKRFAASQMAEAVYDTVSVEVEGPQSLWRASGRAMKFEGFLKVYSLSADENEKEEGEDAEGEEKAAIPADLKEGNALAVERFVKEEHRTSPPPFYNEASLIKAMEKHGIGRPSTYAPTIKTIVGRGYVRRNPKDRRLLASELGILVTESLKEHFPGIVSLTYTAEVEEKLDSIAEGKDEWTSVVRDFYGPFSESMKSASKNMAVVKPEPKMSDEKCPVCGAPMLIRESRFGKYLSCSTFPKCKGKVRLNADGAADAPEPTDEKCDLCGKPMVIRTGRKGRFLACSGYPACRNTFSMDAEGKKIEGSRPVVTKRQCQKCGRAMWLRQGKRGFFLTCPGFPKCRNLIPVSKDDAQTLRDGAAPPPAGPAAAG
ncbi:MAG TPA: type I DNA topoisomerase [Elusimicrobiota bacterium]|nr:type I DNA topoisomerase [Elusimicrobiota bacterium]